jgi:hypothetical protein
LFFGQEHPDTLTIISHLAFTYYYQERRTEAVELAVEVVDVLKMLQGLEHLDTFVTM